MDPTGILLQTSIFGDLAAEDVEELLPDVRERTYGRGESVWLEGDPADAVVVLAEGQLKAHRSSADGREVIVAVYSGVAVTGEVGAFHPAGVRWMGLTAMTPARCLMLRRGPLLDFLARHPVAMRRMLESLSMAGVRAANAFSGLAFDDIGRRVASQLLVLAAEHGQASDDGTRIGLRLSQAELAAQIGATRENVNRALASLASGGVVTHRGGHFHVHDRDALAQAATNDVRLG